ncbi:MAG: SPOR domain-containing protein [Muribaculaceae bacterium]|nr:SPOR domain-containing protein [Muribaculaceae bacterium]
MAISRNILASAALCAVLSVSASAPEGITAHIEAGGTITVVQPEGLAARVNKAVAPSNAERGTSDAAPVEKATPTVRAGYRVQVFDDNDPRTARRQAEAHQAQVAAHFPHLSTYVTFNSPYWRVKVGDFRTRAEAEATMAELRHALPAMAPYMRIVREKINIKD